MYIQVLLIKSKAIHADYYKFPHNLDTLSSYTGKYLNRRYIYIVALFRLAFTTQCKLLMHTTACVQLNYMIATMFNNHLASINALQARNRGEVHPCHISVHGVTCVAA